MFKKTRLPCSQDNGEECGGEDRIHQAFLNGHDGDISSLELSPSERLLASYEQGQNAKLILWDMQQGKRLVTLYPHEENIIDVSFSNESSLLVTCGRDAQRRTQIAVWDTQMLIMDKSNAFGNQSKRSPKDTIVAKQVSDFHLIKMKFLQRIESGGDDHKLDPVLVSCGRENIRFWRIRRGIYQADPLTRRIFWGHFSNIGFCMETGNMFVTSNECPLKIDPDKEQIICSYRL